MSTDTSVANPIKPSRRLPCRIETVRIGERRCPTCPDLVSELGCYIDHERGILRELREARLAGSDDAEVLELDAAQARRHIDGLIALAARAARP